MRWLRTRSQARAECQQCKEDEAAMRKEASEALDLHNAELRRQEAQLMKTSASLALVKQLLSAVEAETGGLQEEQRKQLLRHGQIGQQCARLSEYGELAQAKNAQMIQFSSELRQQARAADEQRHTLSEVAAEMTAQLKDASAQRVATLELAAGHQASSARLRRSMVELAVELYNYKAELEQQSNTSRRCREEDEAGRAEASLLAREAGELEERLDMLLGWRRPRRSLSNGAHRRNFSRQERF